LNPHVLDTFSVKESGTMNERQKVWMKVVSAVVVAVVLLTALMPAAFAANGDAGRRPRMVQFQGVIESRPTDTKVGTWVIAGRNVQVNERTIINEAAGPAEVGAQVMVLAQVQADESLVAVMIRVLQQRPPATITIKGLVTDLGEDYLVVNGLRIAITAQTVIHGELSLGAAVVVRAKVLPGATPGAAVQLEAVIINVVENGWPHRRVMEFTGVVQSIEPADANQQLWTIGERQVLVTEHTLLIGEPKVGDTVLVRAVELPDGRLIAVQIKNLSGLEPPQPIIIEGRIQRLPPRIFGTWQVADKYVEVTPWTQIEGRPAVGKFAHVEAVLSPSGRLMAVLVRISDTAP
jgi:hypothetical protein